MPKPSRLYMRGRQARRPRPPSATHEAGPYRVLPPQVLMHRIKEPITADGG
eukprot:CAMPEP_0180131156 /NCGR_PEP_ID=MMETSP0986-20121125/8261_1 /TAXON_ID=697907 /ORGANISM="non described non described, Strain CCMP2293" /LENGTH=50 /DNA_ID=CAMNT_0022070997 /DNA_START=167 /DNA_END=319 /DNA_ORIENTATION=+